MHTYIPIFPPSCVSLPPSLSDSSRRSQSTELISLCYAAASHQLFILHLVVYICQYYSLTSSQLTLPPPPPRPHLLRSLHLHLCSCLSLKWGLESQFYFLKMFLKEKKPFKKYFNKIAFLNPLLKIHIFLHVKGSQNFCNQEILYAYLHLFPKSGLTTGCFLFLCFVQYLATFHIFIVFLGTSLGEHKSSLTSDPVQDPFLYLRVIL